LSSDDLPPKDGEKKKSLRLVKDGDENKPAPSAKPSPDSIRQLYMASDHIEWTPFAKSMGWQSASSRSGLPVEEWIKQKRDVFAKEQAETIAEAVFKHRGRWHSDVLKTLTEYPEANDAMLGILKKRLNDIIQTINEDEQKKQQAKITGLEAYSAFKAIKSSELLSLAAAIKVATESKHKSLMINDWSFKVAETFSDPAQFHVEQEKIENAEWKVTIRGGENLSSKQITKMMSDWYDKPSLPHTFDEVKNSAEGEPDA